jgi:tetratricopeptide (TPR) repeat protein
VPYNCTTGQRPVEIGVADNYKYKAFISYSHSDEKWAAWLHRALETYKVPKHIVGETTECGTVPERLAPVFRDREELATSTSLGDTLTQALRDSACQIVICSPRAAKSRWTNEEILTFKRLGRSNRIYCLIVDGEPGASDRPETADEECFPPALRYEMGEDGELTDIRSEPIAADARKGKDPKPLAKLKLIAGMLGVGFDDLRQREAQRRHRRMMVLTTAAFVGMAITSGLAVTAYLARIEAEEQRRIAEVEAETARQTTDFMVGLFEVSDPSEALGNTITAREILDKGVERIDEELADQPEIQATLMDTMGTVYTSLGLYDEAVPLVAKSVERRRTIFGNEHPGVAQSLNHLGEVQALKAEFDEAEKNLREALAVRRNLLGSEAPDVADTLTQLAYVLTEKGDYPAAEPLIRESLEIRRAVFGESHPDVAESLEELGLNSFDQGDYKESVTLLREAVAMRRETQGELHPDLAEAINNLAFVLFQTGALEEAESLMREALAMQRRLLGEEHPEVAVNMSNVAYLLYAKGDYDAAEPIYREVIAMEKKLLGEEHPAVAESLNNLAWLMHDKGDRSAAIALARESLGVKRNVLGDVHPDVASGLNTIAMWAMESGDYQSAEPMLRESLDMRMGLLGPEHPDVAGSMTLLANCLVANGAYDEALEFARKARSVYTAALSEDHWRTAVAIGAEGAALAGQHRYADAEKLLLQSHTILSQDQNAMTLFVTEANRRLASFYSEWGKPELAAEYLAMAQE